MPIKLTTKPTEYSPDGEKLAQFREDDVLMSWKSREFIQYERNPGWMVALYAIAALILIYAIWTTNFLFAVLIVISVIVIYTYVQKKPAVLDVAIMKKGVKLNNTLYTYEDDLENFWVLYNPPDLKTLNIKRRQTFYPVLVIQLEDQNPLKIREYLLKNIPEDTTQEESMIDKTARRIGF